MILSKNNVIIFIFKYKQCVFFFFCTFNTFSVFFYHHKKYVHFKCLWVNNIKNISVAVYSFSNWWKNAKMYQTIYCLEKDIYWALFWLDENWTPVKNIKLRTGGLQSFLLCVGRDYYFDTFLFNNKISKNFSKILSVQE